VLVSDPMQLQHVSRLHVAIEQALLHQYELTNASVQRFTYRVNSAFDLADANPSVPHEARVSLALHFRSHDLIADYCNEAFYARTLHVVTVTERLKIPRGARWRTSRDSLDSRGGSVAAWTDWCLVRGGSKGHQRRAVGTGCQGLSGDGWRGDAVPARRI
jgi:hypothetical protein